MIHKRIHEDDEFKEATASTPINSKVNEFATANLDREMGLTKSYNSSKLLTSTSTTLLNQTPDNPTKPKINQNKTNPKMQIQHELRQTNIKSKDKDVNNEKANNKKKQMLPTTPSLPATHPTQPVTVTTETLYRTSQKIDSAPTTVGKAVYSKSTTASPAVTTTPKRMVTGSVESFSVTMDTTRQEQHSIAVNNLVKPYSRSHVLSRMQEKINSLECDIQMQNEPIDSSIWRGNETHELCLPNTVSVSSNVYILLPGKL